MKCRSERQNVRKDEPAAPRIPEVGRAALCSEQDSVSRNGPWGLRLETAWACVFLLQQTATLFVIAGEWVRNRRMVIQGVVRHQSQDNA